MRVLIIQSPTSNDAHVLKAAMQTPRFVVDVAENVDDGIAQAVYFNYSIILISIESLGAQEKNILRQLQKQELRAPVFLLHRDSAERTLAAFDLGVTDCQQKAIGPQEISMRIKAIVWRSKGYSSPILQQGHLSLNLITNEVKVGSDVYKLPRIEYLILELLFLEKDVILKMEALMDQIYAGDDEPESNSIQVILHKLRKKLKARSGIDPISTIRDFGYRLDTTKKGPKR